MFNPAILTGDGLPDISFESNELGGVTIKAGGWPVVRINNGGGHWEMEMTGSLPTDGTTGFEIEDGGFIAVTKG